MRFPRFLFSSLVTLGALTATSLAQAPAAPTAFDGKYVGAATLTHGNESGCRTITSVDMTIRGGQVVIHLIYFNTEGRSTYSGSVNSAGKVSASREIYGFLITISGIIRDNVFTGARTAAGSSRNSCFYSFEMKRT